MRSFASAPTLVVLSALGMTSLAACSSLLGFEELSPASDDAGAALPDGAQPDSPVPEAGGDADAAADSPDSQLPDASSDQVSPDALPDALPDASPDALPDALPDAPPDALPDAPPDGADGGEDAQEAEASCGDTTSNPAHCGRCNHSCLGGQCEQGMCKAFKLTTLDDGAWGIAVDDTHLYVAIQLNNEIARVAKTSGAVEGYETAMAVLVPTWIAVDDTRFAWSNKLTNTGTVTSCPLAGCGGPPTVLASNVNRPNGVALDAGQLYWAETYGHRLLKASAVDGSGVVELIPASLAYQPVRIALHGNDVFVTEISAGKVLRVPKNGGAVLALGSSASPGGIVVTDDKVFWVDQQYSSGRVLSVPNTDPPDGGHSFTEVAWGQDYPYSIAVDSENVYWVATASSSAAQGAVRYCPLSGCPGTGPITLADQVAYPIDLALDDKAIYVSVFGIDTATDGAILKIAKP